MNKKLEKVILAIGCGTLLGTYVTFHYIFWTAYTSQDKAVLLFINKVGEAIPEGILLIISIPCIAYVIKKWFRGKEAK